MLREIRSRYQGHLAVYGYQMQLDPSMLNGPSCPCPASATQPQRADSVTRQSAGPSTRKQHEEFNGQGLHILAVDDHLPNLIVLEALLGELNVTTTKALSGQEAIDIIQRRYETGNSQHLIWSLWTFRCQSCRGSIPPVLFARWNRTFENHSRLPIIALTAHALSDEKHKLLQNGMDDYVTKPIQIEQIIQILTHWTTEHFKRIPVLERANVIDALDPNILDWQQSLQTGSQ